jgi:hypothetical protein
MQQQTELAIRARSSGKIKITISSPITVSPIIKHCKGWKFAGPFDNLLPARPGPIYRTV